MADYITKKDKTESKYITKKDKTESKYITKKDKTESKYITKKDKTEYITKKPEKKNWITIKNSKTNPARPHGGWKN